MANSVRALRVSASVCLSILCAAFQASAAGNPDDVALAQARLVSTSCKRIESDGLGEQERLIQQMREEMKESLER